PFPRGLANHRSWGGIEQGDGRALAVEHLAGLGRDLILPVVALVDGLVALLAVLFIIEAADPDVGAVVLGADEAADDDHAHLRLKGDDLLLHALDPGLLLARLDAVLAQLEQHCFPNLSLIFPVCPDGAHRTRIRAGREDRSRSCRRMPERSGGRSLLMFP